MMKNNLKQHQHEEEVDQKKKKQFLRNLPIVLQIDQILVHVKKIDVKYHRNQQDVLQLKDLIELKDFQNLHQNRKIYGNYEKIMI